MSQSYPDLYLTNFPEAVDNIEDVMDITATDGPLIQQYMSALNAGNQTQANAILATIPNWWRKTISAQNINRISQAVLATERFYKNDVQTYINNLMAEWTTKVNAFDLIGTWNSGQAYVKNNMVSYQNGTSTLIYLAIENVPVGTLITNTAYWRNITVQGIQGESGVGLAYRGEYSDGQVYGNEDAVTYNSEVWMCLQDDTSVTTPGSDPEKWQLVMTLQSATYPIQNTQPEGQAVGSLWFDTSGN